ncbi:MAG: periplasmic heavy metal sensor [Deltaproteobacteria bacterium]|nr:periplasmic heavy metal sensor [Deltaproteobacteria bacterium]
MRTRHIPLAAGVAALLATAATAQMGVGGPPGPPPFMDGGAGRVLALLMRPDQLSDSQEAQVKDIMDNDRASLHALMDKLRDANEQLGQALLASQAPTAESLAALGEQIGELRAQMVAQQVQTALAVRGVLSAEQIAEAAARRDKLAAAHEHDVLFVAP